MRAPEFWTRRSAIAWALAPFGFLYGLGARLRQRLSDPPAVDVPVLCVGNLTVGGAGKTPTALAVLDILRAQGLKPHFLTRGYGGRLAGPVRVDPAVHGAADVGDEPLLLAAAAPCWVARDRHAGAQAAIAAGADAIVMDDGLQNLGLRKTLSLAVVDGAAGFGNGFVMPAGPLREWVGGGLKRVQALVVVEPVTPQVQAALAAVAGPRPLFRARFVPDAHARALEGRKVVAFAGIARPEKFFATLHELGCTVAETAAFDDHHPYRPDELTALRGRADGLGAVLVTTTKDHVRLPDAMRGNVVAVAGTLDFERREDVIALIVQTIGETRDA